jgi:hypothetical protein
MREFEGRSYEEIGLALGTNDGAVRQLLNRARGTLRAAATAVLPPPLVARLATSPPDGRRIAEIVGGLGAAGVAKAGATALVAGTLVVGAINVPLPAGHGNTTRQNAMLSVSGPAKKVASPATHASAPVAFRPSAAHPVAGSKRHNVARHVASTAPAGVKDTNHSGSGQSGSSGQTGSREHSGSGNDGQSGSGDTGHSGSDDSLVRSPGSNGSGSDDHASHEADGSPDKSGSDGPHTSTAPEAVPRSPDGGGVDEPEDPPATAP